MATVLVVLCATASTALAADEHTLDPVLSLGGGTDSTTLDPVPDPGPNHPKKGFSNPCGVATDAYGDVYVANASPGSPQDGAIDVFNSAGEFITGVPSEHAPCTIAVDSVGHIYARQTLGTPDVVRYDPIVYQPDADQIAYAPTPTLVSSGVEGIGLDPLQDNLYVSHGNLESKFRFEVFSAGGSLVDTFTENVFGEPKEIGVYGQTQDIYASGYPWEPVYKPDQGRVYVLDGSTHEVKLTLDGSNTPAGDFGFTFGRGGIAVDQSNGDVYVDAVRVHHLVDQFDADGNFIAELQLPGNGFKASEPFNGIAVDQGEHSPNKGYVYIASGSEPANSHLYAFAPRDVGAPEVRNAHLHEAGETEALLKGEVNPHGAATGYRFEYGLGDCASNPCQNSPVPDASAGEGGAFRVVLASLGGLQPGTKYHFRLVATNRCNLLEPDEECVAEGPDETFTTFSAPPDEACPNAALRVGSSAGLVDCRAYELVSPADTNGRIPTGAVFGTGVGTSPLPLVSANGESAVFGAEGGTLPGSPGGGFYDTYHVTRGTDAWHTEFAGLTGTQAEEAYAGSVSSDHAYSLFLVERQKGTLPRGQYLRGPAGSVEPVGIGSLNPGQPGDAQGRWISSGAAHLIFTASEPLEVGAPPSGTRAVYDRSPGGPTHVVSLLPGEVTPAAGNGAQYLGAAAQGSAVAFRVGGAIYLRLANAETVKVADDPASFGGIAADGGRVLYVKGGNVFAFEAATHDTVAIGGGGKSTMVNVSADGSHVYFVSPLVLTGGEANSQGAAALGGSENLYVWDAASEETRFIATVTEEDVVGEDPPSGGSGALIGGLGLWDSDAVAADQDRFRGPANDPSRTNPNGGVLVFESRAPLTGYDSEGRSEVYRYAASSAVLSCISCNPTNAPAVSDARLESRYPSLLSSIPPVNAVSQIANVTADGDTVFFQSGDRLDPGDVDGKIDVYEWRAQGTGGCDDQAGCIRLISGGHSSADDYLYGASNDGTSVFFLSGDALVPEDTSGTPSIYVAREDGGFASPSDTPAECLGEACQPAVAAPVEPTPAFVGPGDPRLGPKRCPKGRHRVRGKSGRAHCSKRHAGRHRSQSGARAPR